jgi:anti-sigma factor RsiW
MRCRHARQLVLEDRERRSSGIEEHLGSCAECSAYARHWDELRRGLRRVAEDPTPEATFGFAQRASRLLQDVLGAERASEVFLERAGRRFVYAALLATFILFLVLLVPRTSPVRSAEAAEIGLAQPEASAAQNYPLFSGQLLANDFEFAAQSGGH